MSIIDLKQYKKRQKEQEFIKTIDELEHRLDEVDSEINDIIKYWEKAVDPILIARLLSGYIGYLCAKHSEYERAYLVCQNDILHRITLEIAKKEGFQELITTKDSNNNDDLGGK